jgi:hypothetical protein
MNDEARKSKDRSPNFPFITLSAALTRAQEFYSAEKRGTAPYTVAATHWNYSPTSSGGMQTMAALKSYGIMSDEGAGAQRMVRLSDLGLRILLDSRPDSAERAKHLRAAALNPSVAAQVHKKWPDSLPSDANLNHYLIFDLKFNDATASKVVKILKANEQLTRLNTSEVSLSDKDIEDDIAQETAMDLQPTIPQPQPKPSAQPVSPQPAEGNFERIRSPIAGYIQIHFPQEPTFEVYDFLEKYMAFMKGGMKPREG